jgi:hypothetical protein
VGGSGVEGAGVCVGALVARVRGVFVGSAVASGGTVTVAVGGATVAGGGVGVTVANGDTNRRLQPAESSRRTINQGLCASLFMRTPLRSDSLAETGTQYVQTSGLH